MRITGDGHSYNLDDKPLSTLNNKTLNKSGMGRLWESYQVEWLTLQSYGKDHSMHPIKHHKQRCGQKKAITGTHDKWSWYTTFSNRQISTEKRAVRGIPTPASSIEAQREMQEDWLLQRKRKMKKVPHWAENHELRFLREWLKKAKHMILGIKWY